jgi:putative nucleotidyltransferase with HDIG domain
VRSGCFDARALFWFRIGALLHDVGKLVVPAEVLNKPGKLNADEWALMRSHTTAGVEIIADIEFPWDIRPIVQYHHERWDGRGYHGLAGEAIPLAARIVSACDAFNAMTTDRSYRKALPLEVAIAELRANRGTQFAPDVVDALIAVVTRERPDWELALAAPPSGIEAEPQPVEQA